MCLRVRVHATRLDSLLVCVSVCECKYMCWYVYSPMGAITLPCALCKNNAECVRACLCVYV